MSIIKRALKQSTIYMIFQGIGQCLSLVTFPILTRVLTIADYGNLALINATLSIALALAKCGITTSFIRFFPRYKSKKNHKLLYSSSLFGAISTSFIIIIGYISIIITFHHSFSNEILDLFLLVSILIFTRNMSALITSWLRAEEKVITLSSLNLIGKLGGFSCGIFCYFYFSKKLSGFFIGTITFDLLMISFLLNIYYRKKLISVLSFSLSIIKEMYLYGFPMIFYEISSLINDYADRFMIKYFLGSEKVGIYSVGYNLSLYAQSLITAPLWMAIFPIYTKIWEDEGKEATVNFLSLLLKYYLCLSVLTIFGMSLCSKDMILVLASAKYSQAASIVPYVITSVMIFGIYHIVGASFFLLKKTSKLATYTMIAAFLNITMNVILIPKFNITGAALSTVVSYGFLSIVITYSSNRSLKLNWPIKNLILYLITATFVYICLRIIHIEKYYISLLFKLTLFVTVYFLVIISTDFKLRNILSKMIKKLVDKMSSAA